MGEEENAVIKAYEDGTEERHLLETRAKNVRVGEKEKKEKKEGTETSGGAQQDTATMGVNRQNQLSFGHLWGKSRGL